MKSLTRLAIYKWCWICWYQNRRDMNLMYYILKFKFLCFRKLLLELLRNCWSPLSEVTVSPLPNNRCCLITKLHGVLFQTTVTNLHLIILHHIAINTHNIISCTLWHWVTPANLHRSLRNDNVCFCTWMADKRSVFTFCWR